MLEIAKRKGLPLGGGLGSAGVEIKSEKLNRCSAMRTTCIAGRSIVTSWTTGARRNYDVEVADIDEGIRAVPLANVQLVEIQLEPVRVEPNLADTDGAMQRRSQLPGGYVPQEQWYADEARQAEERDDTQDAQSDFAHAARAAKFRCARGKRPDALRRGLTKVDHARCSMPRSHTNTKTRAPPCAQLLTVTRTLVHLPRGTGTIADLCGRRVGLAEI